MRTLAACVLFLGLVISFQAVADERFTVEIKVDVTDQNASVAREKALAGATRAAISAVARRISTTEGANTIAAMTDAQLINFIKETSVVNERNSDVRYIADLRITVNEDLLKQYMQERNIPLVLKNNAPVLVIPVFREFTDDTPMLWEVDNLWKQAWDNAQSTSAVKFSSVISSAGNMETLSAEQAAAIDASALEKIMHMVGAADVWVLDASYNGVEGLDITATSLSGSRQNIKVSGAKSSGMELFNQAVIETRKQLEKNVLENADKQAAAETELTVLYPFQSLSQWIAAEQKIKNLNEITNMQVQAMAPRKAQFKIWYTGDFKTLQRQFRNKGYRLENGGDYMILQNLGEE